MMEIMQYACSFIPASFDLEASGTLGSMGTTGEWEAKAKSEVSGNDDGDDDGDDDDNDDNDDDDDDDDGVWR